MEDVILHEKISKEYGINFANFATLRIFKVDFLGNEVSDKKNVLGIINLFFHVESHPPRLYH